MSFKVVGIGEVLWDLLPSGSQLGGAPASFACHAHALGTRACVVTRVGNDGFGHAILQRFVEQGIADDMVQVDDEAPTGTVTFALSEQGIPNYSIQEKVAWDRLAVTQTALKTVGPRSLGIRLFKKVKTPHFHGAFINATGGNHSNVPLFLPGKSAGN